ncbi:MAG TPA: sugar dehydrogenase complex small subunit [Methyloceanibacter sp.]|nr:sugar dehydrogenase complex small subunit [Methyloceanibacter sp.]
MHLHEDKMPTISRRGLMLGSASAATLALAFPLRAVSGDTISAEQFRALSTRLTGAKLGDLDMGAAAKLLAGFLSMGHGAELSGLAADRAASAGTLATEIVAAWYSGNFRTAGGLTSIGLPNALLWDALDFTKPPGFCGGLTGYWADAPRA